MLFRSSVTDRMLECLRLSVNAAEKSGVTLLIETVGIFADTSKLCDVLNSFACDNLAALWDMHHPFRFNNESPEETIRNLGAYVKHVHIKDSEIVDGVLRYRLLGDGELPIANMVDALRSINYDGFISFEWNPEWMPELDDMDSKALWFALRLLFASRLVS